MEQKEEESALESLNTKLNQSDSEQIHEEMPVQPKSMDGVLPPEKTEVKTGWEASAKKVLQKAGQMTTMKKKNVFLKRFLWVAVIFFLISVAFAGYIFVGGLNQVSPENIVITLEGDNNSPAGKVYNFSLKLQNNNNVILENTSMTVEFPEGTRSSINPTLDLRREKVDTSAVESRGVIEEDFSALLYGNKGENKKIIVSFEYHVAGSNSAFTKVQEFNVGIDNSPIIVEIDMGTDFISGQEFKTEILISSNTNEVVRDVVLIAEYPFGFEFMSSIPEASFEKEVWFLDNIDPTEKQKIIVRGKVVGNANDERTIRLSLGIRDTNDQNEIGSLITQKNHTYSIKKPLLELAVSMNGKISDEVAFNMGQGINVSLDVINNLEAEAENTVVEIAIPRSLIIDDSTIRVTGGGFYRSSDRKIVWDRNNNSSLRTILPGDSVNLSFSMETIPSSSSIAISQRNPNFRITGTVSGNTDTKKVVTSINKLVKINSKIDVAARSGYSSTSILNTGPLPPKVNTETTYTIKWLLSNRYNTLSGARVSARLPGYIDWKGVISPSSETVTFNSNTREVVWDIGRAQAGIGQSSSPKEVSFQIGLVPSVSQVATVPVLVQNIRASAVDDFTDTKLTDSINNITTLIQNDPIYIRDMERVVE